MFRTIVLFLSPGFHLADLGALSAFDLANEAASVPCYDVRVLTRDGVPVTSAAGIAVASSAAAGMRGPIDTLLVGGADAARAPDDGSVAALRRAGSAARRIATFGAGAALLAPTGLLDGRQVAIGAAHAAALRARHPALVVAADRVWLRDGHVWS